MVGILKMCQGSTDETNEDQLYWLTASMQSKSCVFSFSMYCIVFTFSVHTFFRSSEQKAVIVQLMETMVVVPLVFNRSKTFCYGPPQSSPTTSIDLVNSSSIPSPPGHIGNDGWMIGHYVNRSQDSACLY